jgi:hypothetical protein
LPQPVANGNAFQASGDGATTDGPAGPCGPREPREPRRALGARSLCRRERSLTLTDVTALRLSWALPMLLRAIA